MKNQIRLFSILLVSFLVIAFIIPSSKAAGEIGVIDNAKVLDQYTASQEAQKTIVQGRVKLQQVFADLNKQLEDTIKNKDLTETQKLTKRKEAQDKLETEKKKLDTSIQALRNNLETKIETAINDEAKAQGLSMVVSKSVTYYGGKDVTDQVLKRLNGK
jgi:outer membrane protein